MFALKVPHIVRADIEELCNYDFDKERYVTKMRYTNRAFMEYLSETVGSGSQAPLARLIILTACYLINQRTDIPYIPPETICSLGHDQAKKKWPERTIDRIENDNADLAIFIISWINSAIRNEEEQGRAGFSFATAYALIERQLEIKQLEEQWSG